jgi:uncharacterized protein (DUF1330 family)
MTAYALIELEVTNVDGMAPYIEAVAETIAAHGGEYLVLAREVEDVEVVEGGIGEYPRKVVLEFPTMEAAKRWCNSSEYQAILPFRTNNSKCDFLWVEGLENSRI